MRGKTEVKERRLRDSKARFTFETRRQPRYDDFSKGKREIISAFKRKYVNFRITTKLSREAR